MRSLCFALILLAFAQVAAAADWLTAPSYYTHDPVTAERVTQYAEIGPYYYYYRPDFQRSGYRQFRSTIQAGNSADNMHIVEEYGNPVRPYEEWRFPYRPYSVPYDAWGPPFGGLGGNAGYGGYPAGGYPYGGFGQFPPNGPIGPGPVGPIGPGGFGGGFGPGGFGPIRGGAQNFAQPWLDGYYPTYDRNDRSRYYDPYPGR
jgi:hypothetical protein